MWRARILASLAMSQRRPRRDAYLELPPVLRGRARPVNPAAGSPPAAPPAAPPPPSADHCRSGRWRPGRSCTGLLGGVGGVGGPLQHRVHNRAGQAMPRRVRYRREVDTWLPEQPCAASHAARSSTGPYCDSCTPKPGVINPPVAMILMISTPAATRCATAARTPSIPSAAPPRNQQCPPVRVIGGPDISSSGPPVQPLRTRPVR